MLNRWKIVVGLVTLILLVAGVYFISDVYACGKCAKGDDHGKQPSDSAKSGTTSDKEKEDPNTPDNLIKTADKLLKDADKTKDTASLMKHCEQMLNKSAEMISECNHQIKETGKTDGEAVETATKLMKKCIEMTTKYQSLLPKESLLQKEQKKSTEEKEKAVYKCPMGCATSDKPGKCPHCGMNLEKMK